MWEEVMASDERTITEEEAAQRLSRLSQRERQVLLAYCANMGYEHIGELLGLSPSTVRVYMFTITAKLELSDVSPSKKKQIIRQYFCPVLKTGIPTPPPPEPAPDIKPLTVAQN